MALPQALVDRMGVPVVDEVTIDALLGDGGGARRLLLFAGDPAQRPEAIDVAVIFPELLRAFGDRLKGAVVAPDAERALGQRFHVDVFPSLAVIRDGVTIGVIPRIRDWAEYIEKIESFLRSDPAGLAKGAGPRVEITYSHKGATA